MLKIITGFLGWFFGGSDQSELVEGPQFEKLEGKVLMSANPTIAVGVDPWGNLHVQGTEGKDKVAIEVRGTPQGDITRVTVGKMTSVFADVQSIEVNLRAGKDTIKVSVIAPEQLIPVTVRGGEDNDVIRFEAVGLSHNNSFLFNLFGEDGDDKIFVDSDTFVSAYGGTGRDLIATTKALPFAVRHWFYGGLDNDKLVTHTGGYLYGNEGDDRLISKSIFGANITTGSGNDIARGVGDYNSFRIEGSGNKKITGGSGMDYVTVNIGLVWNGTFYEESPPFAGRIVFNGKGGDNYLTVPTGFDQSQLKIKNVTVFTHSIGGGKG